MKEQKCRYNKENVIAMLEQEEKIYNQKWVDAFNKQDKEKMRMFGDMKNAIQLLLIKFEEEFI